MDAALKKLLKKQIYLGTSSWKYEGWKDLVYKRSYPTAKSFKETCLEEFATQYTCVGVDHTYYTWPRRQMFQGYDGQTPDSFKMGLKATENVTVFKFPKQPRYGKKAGTLNEHFLDPKVFVERFLEPLRPFQKKLAPIMLEFSQFYPGTIGSGSEFCDRINDFFTGLKGEKGFSFSIELRNKSWLQPKYFETLLKHKVSHVFNSWTRMPSIAEQLDIAKDFKFPSYPARVLLRPGTQYATAVKNFSPYDKIQDKQPEVRAAVAELIERAMDLGVPAYVFVNNRCEGSAPLTIEGILKELK